VTYATAIVHPVHLTNVGQRRAAADPPTKPTDLGVESACIGCYMTCIYHRHLLLLMLFSVGGRSKTWSYGNIALFHNDVKDRVLNWHQRRLTGDDGRRSSGLDRYNERCRQSFDEQFVIVVTHGVRQEPDIVQATHAWRHLVRGSRKPSWWQTHAHIFSSRLQTRIFWRKNCSP